MSLIFAGKVWKFGDHISTDYMAPSFALDQPWEKQQRSILHIHKAFTKECQPGDAIIAGRNFGCGSSREQAPANLKRLGISCVVAESFGRIFFRNCIAIALPVVICHGVSELFEEGETLELNLKTSMVKNLTTGRELTGGRLSPELLSIIEKGGILEFLKSESQKKNSILEDHLEENDLL